MVQWIAQYPPTVQALFACLFTWFVTALGSALVFLFRSFNKKVFDAMLGFAAGVMIAASFWSLLAPGIELAESMGKVGVSTSGLGGASDASGIAGKIAKVEGGSVFLNVGAEAGVKEGDTFDVYRVGNVIKDPDTGEVLGSDETKVGRVKITKVMGARLSTASVVSGSGFKPGDMIKN